MELFNLNLREPAKEISAYLVYFLSNHLQTICDRPLYEKTYVISEPWISPNPSKNSTNLYIQPMEISKKYVNKTSKFYEMDSMIVLRVTAMSDQKRSLAFEILPKLESLCINAMRNMNGLDSLYLFERETQYQRDLLGTMSVCGFDLTINAQYRNFFETNACQAYDLLESIGINLNKIMELNKWH